MPFVLVKTQDLEHHQLPHVDASLVRRQMLLLIFNVYHATAKEMT
jgi:hypothetical protein